MQAVLITGASKGIGLAISAELVDVGYRAIGIARTCQNDYPGVFSGQTICVGGGGNL